MINPSDLHVICVVSNPIRFNSRDKLFREFRERMQKSKATVWIVEARFGERDFTHVDPLDPHHILLDFNQEVWKKEAMINAATRFLPRDWKYVMWMDGDIEFINREWETEVIQQLQHFSVVQPFQHAIDLGPDLEVMKQHQSFGSTYVNGSYQIAKDAPAGGIQATYYYGNNRMNSRSGAYAHPGYA